MKAGSGVAAGKALDRRGKPLTIRKLKGPVEPYFRDPSDAGPTG